jgi:hypothetical protein
MCKSLVRHCVLLLFVGWKINSTVCTAVDSIEDLKPARFHQSAPKPTHAPKIFRGSSKFDKNVETIPRVLKVLSFVFLMLSCINLTITKLFLEFLCRGAYTCNLQAKMPSVGKYCDNRKNWTARSPDLTLFVPLKNGSSFRQAKVCRGTAFNSTPQFTVLLLASHRIASQGPRHSNGSLHISDLCASSVVI